MGEIAEMMLDGTMCEQCGEFIDTDNGYPTLCAGCAGDGAPVGGELQPKKKRKKRRGHRGRRP